MGIKRIKIQNQRTTSGSGYFKKTSQNCRVSRKPGKEEPVDFWAIILLLQFEIWVSKPRQTNKRDLGFKTSTDRLTN